jgi:hypothetical protein
MPTRRGGREGDALNDATDPPASSAELPKTRSGLVWEAPPTSKTRERRGTIHDAHEEVDGSDVRTRMALGSVRDESQGQSTDLKLALQANAQLMGQFKSIAESYQKGLEICMGETAAARKEAAESQLLIVELQKEVATLTALVKTLTLGGSSTAPSMPVSRPGRSWASIVSQSFLASSNTRAARAGLGLPAVVLDLRSATEETKALVDDPTRTREKIRSILKDDTVTANVGIEGVKPTSCSTVKVFVDLEESVKNLS